LGHLSHLPLLLLWSVYGGAFEECVLLVYTKNGIDEKPSTPNIVEPFCLIKVF